MASATPSHSNSTRRSLLAWIRWFATKIFVPLISAIIATAGFSEIILNFFSLIFQKEPNWVGGTYQPSDDAGHYGYFTDSWFLKSSNERLNATIKKDDPGIQSEWIAQGYNHNNTYTISYKTNREGSAGVGTFHLVQVGSREEYRGYQINFDCDAQKSMACPYILVPAKARDLLRETSRVNYLKKGCLDLNSPPPPNSCSTR